MTQALEGLKVLDLCRRYPGAYTAMFLGDFGAQVIKVDPPGGGLPVPGSGDSEAFAAHYAPDRNKRSIILNLREETGQQVFYRLARWADVLVEGFRPGVMKKLKADYDTLQALNPRLIYCSLSGFGHDGPYAHLPAHDMNYCAIAGALSVIGPKDGPPYFASNYLADMAGAGLHGVIGILLAVQAREKTGQGQWVDVTYVDGVISLATMDVSRFLHSGKVPRRGETHTTGAAPWAQVFKCKDGEYFTIGCAEQHLWANLCKALGRDDLAPFHNPPPDKRDWVIAEMARIFLTKTRDEWWKFFQDKDTCVGPVYYFNETLADPQVRHRQMVVELEHPKLGKVKQVGIPIKLSKTPGKIRTLGTPMGTHTREVLKELGYGPKEIDQLYQGSAVS